MKTQDLPQAHFIRAKLYRAPLVGGDVVYVDAYSASQAADVLKERGYKIAEYPMAWPRFAGKDKNVESKG